MFYGYSVPPSKGRKKPTARSLLKFVSIFCAPDWSKTLSCRHWGILRPCLAILKRQISSHLASAIGPRCKAPRHGCRTPRVSVRCTMGSKGVLNDPCISAKLFSKSLQRLSLEAVQAQIQQNNEEAKAHQLYIAGLVEQVRAEGLSRAESLRQFFIKRTSIPARSRSTSNTASVWPSWQRKKPLTVQQSKSLMRIEQSRR